MLTWFLLISGTTPAQQNVHYPPPLAGRSRGWADACKETTEKKETPKEKGASKQASDSDDSKNSSGKSSDSSTTSSGKKKQDKKKKDENPRVIPPITWGGPEGKDYKLQPGVDTRIRGESRHNYAGVQFTEDDDNVAFIRSRVNADLIYKDVVRGFVEILDARVWDADNEYRQEAHFNPQQIFLEFQDPVTTSWSYRLGRQEMEYGRNRRLVESSRWNNIRRTYDGARAIYRTKEMDADLFLVNTTSFERRRDGRVVTDRARHRDDEFFYGAYATLRQWDPHTIETYFLGLSDRDESRNQSEGGRPGTLDRYTVGSALYGPLWNAGEDSTTSAGYGLEGAFQFGHRSTDQIRAYMLHGDLWYEWEHEWKPRITLEGNLASGDRRRGDGVSGTFVPLFGATHGPYGIIDFLRLQNMREVALVGRVNPTEKLRAQLELHAFWLDSPRDAWYDAAGQVVGRDASGRTGRGLGEEIDAVLTYEYSKWLTIEGGAAHFFSGPVARHFGPENGSNFFYIQTQFTF